MPIHDWVRVNPGVFHDFHLSWIAALKLVLNTVRLPSDHYALVEQLADAIDPDELTLEVSGAERSEHLAAYTRKRRTLVIRHVDTHRIVALIEMVSPGNKASQYTVESFAEKVAAALARGIHLLLLDLFPPGPGDPQGIHGAVWDHLATGTYEQPADKPLTLAAYSSGEAMAAYVEPVAVGDALPDMPLFLTPDRYINVPLEATYQAAYAGLPRYYRRILES